MEYSFIVNNNSGSVEKRDLCTIIVFLSVLISLAGLAHLNASLHSGEQFTFDDSQDNRISATYFVGSLPYGLLIAEGFGSDQVAMKTVTLEFVDKGFHVFTFDFSGHGRSSGSIGFDNAETDVLALQLLDSLFEFRRVSGLQIDDVFILGHSLGARIALQVQSMMETTLAGLVLFGTQISLVDNTQAEFFTGTTDADIDWIRELNSTNPDTHVLLLSSTWDDILTPDAARLLYEKLSGADLGETEREHRTTVNGNIKELVILNNILHSFETYSPRMVSASIDWVLARISMTPAGDSVIENRITLKIILWIIGIISLLLLPISLSNYVENRISNTEAPLNQVKLHAQTKYFLWKFGLWILSLPTMFVLILVLFLIPFDLPVFSLTVLGFIAGYGLTNFILYRWGRFPGTEGRWQFRQDNDTQYHRMVRGVSRRTWITIGLGITFILLTTIYANTGFNFTFPLNQRVVWLSIFTIINGFAYLVGNSELVWFYNQNAGRREYTKLLLVALMPFFILLVFYSALGSISGIQGAMLNFIKYGLTLALGWLIQKYGHNIYLTSFFQSFMLQWLILPQGALFSV